MKQLTIYTNRYSQLLEEFTASAASNVLIVRRAGWLNGGLFAINCAYNPAAFARGLMTLLADIALQKNPIYQNSQKLRDMAGDLRGTDLYTTALGELSRFLKHNRILNLEGYVTFRMSEYREKLDMMSYSLIKKMKLIQQD